MHLLRPSVSPASLRNNSFRRTSENTPKFPQQGQWKDFSLSTGENQNAMKRSLERSVIAQDLQRTHIHNIKHSLERFLQVFEKPSSFSLLRWKMKLVQRLQHTPHAPEGEKQKEKACAKMEAAMDACSRFQNDLQDLHQFLSGKEWNMGRDLLHNAKDIHVNMRRMLLQHDEKFLKRYGKPEQPDYLPKEQRDRLYDCIRNEINIAERSVFPDAPTEKRSLPRNVSRLEVLRKAKKGYTLL